MADRMGDLSRRMPGRTAGQFSLFKQYDVGLALFT